MLLRGINVGGKNKISMAALKSCLEGEGFEDVSTYIQSGNVVLRTGLRPRPLGEKIQRLLTETFTLDSALVRVLALSHEAYEKVIAQAPKSFGADDGAYRYYVLFPIGPTTRAAMKVIEVRPGVDRAWVGDVAIYYRLPSLTSPDATKSWLNKVAQKPIYQDLTMRNWRTTKKVLDLLDAKDV